MLPVFTGLSRQHLRELIAELAGSWTTAQEGGLYQDSRSEPMAAGTRGAACWHPTGTPITL